LNLSTPPRLILGIGPSIGKVKFNAPGVASWEAGAEAMYSIRPALIRGIGGETQVFEAKANTQLSLNGLFEYEFTFFSFQDGQDSWGRTTTRSLDIFDSEWKVGVPGLPEGMNASLNSQGMGEMSGSFLLFKIGIEFLPPGG